MLTVGDKFPEFSLTAVCSSNLADAFQTVCDDDGYDKWKVFFFYPKDFTFICPTEICAFNNILPELAKRQTLIYGVSTDSDFVHLAWRKSHADLHNLDLPLLSDIKKELSTALGIIDKNAGVCLRATFIVDPTGTIRHVSVNDLDVGRNEQEILRLVDALQSDGLCACNWQKGDLHISVE